MVCAGKIKTQKRASLLTQVVDVPGFELTEQRSR